MKTSTRIKILAAGAVLLTVGIVSCVSAKYYAEIYSPEESSLNLVKITDETNNSVVAGISSRHRVSSPNSMNAPLYTKQAAGLSPEISWSSGNFLDISPDGKMLAYCTQMNGQHNVMVRSSGAQGMATQRTFRHVSSFSWGDDGKIYFSDINSNNQYICAVDAEQGSLMDQLTNGSVQDKNPIYSADGKKVFFTRTGPQGPFIWSINRENGVLTSCARGFDPCLVKDNPDAFYCTRINSSNFASEIWYVDYVKGKESIVLSDKNKGFSNPKLSPDGKWILCVGTSLSSITKEENLDIFVVRTDGTRLTQLTYHPSIDTSPVWAADGRSIYFISSRANKENYFNVWRMNFTLE